MSDVKILVATHKKYTMPNNSIYLPIHVGKKGKKELGYQGDDNGDNISDKNKNYCELTALYWAWKNIECDFIGLVHYRRYFTKKNFLNRIFSKDKFSSIIDKNDIENYLSQYEIILPIKRNYYIESIWSHYKHAHNIQDMIKVKSIIKKKYPEYIESFNTIMNQSRLHLYNMFIMKKEDLDRYCEWLFDILFELEKNIDIELYDDYQKRVFGFISERLFNVWVLHNNITAKYIPVIEMEDMKYSRKIIEFLKRKIRFKNLERK